MTDQKLISILTNALGTQAGEAVILLPRTLVESLIEELRGDSAVKPDSYKYLVHGEFEGMGDVVSECATLPEALKTAADVHEEIGSAPRVLECVEIPVTYTYRVTADVEPVGASS